MNRILLLLLLLTLVWLPGCKSGTTKEQEVTADTATAPPTEEMVEPELPPDSIEKIKQQ